MALPPKDRPLSCVSPGITLHTSSSDPILTLQIRSLNGDTTSTLFRRLGLEAYTLRLVLQVRGRVRC